MQDNMGNEVPTDLVLMPDIENLSDAELIVVVDAVWYDAMVPTGGGCEIALLCVSENAIDSLSCDTIDDYDGPIHEIMYVNDVLKRWSIEDGFYHA